ncbi:MAG: class I SAM-dependent methyltransferase [Oscillospiraceae bacterium]|nr:class I SAM-dependent methyltransferase [Oscillospiraceae bacterium]
MLSKIKRLMSLFLPPPARTFHRQSKLLLDEIRCLQCSVRSGNKELDSKIKTIGTVLEEIRALDSKLKALSGKAEDRDKWVNGKLESIDSKLEVKSKVFNDRLDAFDRKAGYLQKTADEILWANIFNSTTDNSDWLKIKTFSPGRWAAGYPFLYILYRVLRDVKPKRILELGLGETTRVISQYSAEHQEAEHFVVEHDPEWISFFTKASPLPGNTKIVQLPWGSVSHKDSEAVRVYEGFSERFSNGSYDLLCIDGPLGGDMEQYARIDSLALVPEHLSSSFTVIVDDYDRITEQNMVKDLCEKLDSADIPYAKASYRGMKHAFIACSTDNRFLASL